MELNRTSFALFLWIVFISNFQSVAQDKTQKIVNSLNTVIKPIKTLDADSSFEDINFLKETLQGKEIIALGEATHGTREFFNYKDRLVRFLVTNLEYKSIVFESDFIAVERIDEYINGKINHLGKLYGTALHLNNVKMLEWLKTYNLSQPIENRVHLYGLEARGFNNISTKILEAIPNLAPGDKQVLEKFKVANYATIKKEDIDSLKTTIDNLKKNKYSISIEHYINLLQQNTISFFEKKIGVRDEYMANNASWVKEKTTNGKLIVWAHNGHVAKTNLYNKPSMGTYLYEKYNVNYFVIATDFNHGEVSVIPKNKPTANFNPLYYSPVMSNKAYEYYFKQCKFKNFIIDISSSIKDSILATFYDEFLEMRMIGAESTPVNKKLSISKNFDLILFFDKTTSI